MRVFGLGPTELIIILVIVLVLFGPKQIPKLSRMFGKAVKDLREGMEGEGESEDEAPAKKQQIPEAKAPAEDEVAKKHEETSV